MEKLPIDDALPALMAALDTGTRAVLAAPPGAGKTTRVPLALMAASWATGRILMLEPRRIAARAAAERMAELLGERPGARVGYRIRGEAVAGARIEVVTEGILTRMLQFEPDLPGIAAVVFDEIHERSVQSDLGLALALEVQGALRPDLRLLAMSATLDTGLVSEVMGGAPVIESAGRLHPVETRWRAVPRRGEGRGRPAAIAADLADLVAEALDEAPEGDVLAFLPGAGEIRRAAAALEGRIAADVRPLYGALPFAEQRAALRAGPRRRVVLATSIAETSLTVEGVRVVVDAGYARRARVDPATGMGRLVTVPVSRAEADQRQGRAGRLGPGICYRMWTRGEEGALPLFAPPEIAEADLAGLALEIALWGASPEDLAFLTPPPEARIAEARRLLMDLGALDAAGRITGHGREMAGQPLHPRLAHMLIGASGARERATAAALAAIVSEGDPLAEPRGADLALRLQALAGPSAGQGHRLDPARSDRVRREMRRLGAKGAPDPAGAGAALARAYPDRIALRRKGGAPRFLLANGRGAVMDAGDGLAGARLLVAADLEDLKPEARIRLAAPVDEADLAGAIRAVQVVEWDARTGRVVAAERRALGALVLEERPWADAPPDLVAGALIGGVRAAGARGLAALGWSARAESLRVRRDWLARTAPEVAARLPDWSDAGLLETLEDWLLPWTGGCRSLADLAALDSAAMLEATLDADQRRTLEREAPAAIATPLGRQVALDYRGEAPRLSVRLQEMLGLTRHPVAAGVPVVIELLSPAGRPIQTTQDLPGFWAGSYGGGAQGDARALSQACLAGGSFGGRADAEAQAAGALR